MDPPPAVEPYMDESHPVTLEDHGRAPEGATAVHLGDLVVLARLVESGGRLAVPRWAARLG